MAISSSTCFKSDVFLHIIFSEAFKRSLDLDSQMDLKNKLQIGDQVSQLIFMKKIILLYCLIWCLWKIHPLSDPCEPKKNKPIKYIYIGQIWPILGDNLTNSMLLITRFF